MMPGCGPSLPITHVRFDGEFRKHSELVMLISSFVEIDPNRHCQNVGMCSSPDGGLLSHPTWGGQIFLAQEFRVEQLGLIALSAIREDGHDSLARTEVARKSHGSDDFDGARSTEHQSFMLDQIE